MKLWTFLVISLIVQERISTDAALFQARRHNLNIWHVHIIWLVSTCLTILLGYCIGKLIQKFFRNTRVDLTIKQISKKIENVLGKNGEKYAFILLGLVNFPYLNGMLASVINVPFKNLFPLMLLGDAVWYVSAWIVNIYVRRHVASPHVGLYIVVATGVVLGICYKMLYNKITKED